MEKLELKAKVRSAESPSGLRKSGLIPAIVYGHNIKTEHLEVPYSDFEKIFRKAGESTLITLSVEGAKPKNVIVQDAQKHYLNGKFLHVDFYEVSMTEKMKAHVPLEFIGISKAVKESAGVLVQVINEIEVECLPADLPHSIEVDISVLNTFSDTVHVRDLKVPNAVKILADAGETVAKVAPPRDVEAELATPVVEDISKVEGAAEVKPEDAAAGQAETAEKDGKEEKADKKVEKLEKKE
jgi:large subunit ribosomal protein L25